MTEKRFYYNTFYYRNDMSRVMEYEIIDRKSYPNYPNHNEKEDVPAWCIYIGENDSGWQDMVVDLLNEQEERIQELETEKELLKKDGNNLIQLLENQSLIICELRSKLMEYESKEPIILTKEDLELMGKAVSYYTHGRCPE